MMPEAPTPIPATEPPQWLREYDAALAEKDKPRLFKRVEIAEAALWTRREALMQGPDGHTELREIARALKELQNLKRYVLDFC